MQVIPPLMPWRQDPLLVASCYGTSAMCSQPYVTKVKQENNMCAHKAKCCETGWSYMTVSWYGDVVRISGTVCGEATVSRWFSSQRAGNADFWSFSDVTKNPVMVSASPPIHMMTSSNWNIFRVTGHLCGEFTGPRWIPRTKASDAKL